MSSNFVSHIPDNFSDTDNWKLSCHAICEMMKYENLYLFLRLKQISDANYEKNRNNFLVK